LIFFAFNPPWCCVAYTFKAIQLLDFVQRVKTLLQEVMVPHGLFFIPPTTHLFN